MGTPGCPYLRGAYIFMTPAALLTLSECVGGTVLNVWSLPDFRIVLGECSALWGEPNGTPFVTKLEIAYGDHVSLHGHRVSLHGHHVR